MPVVTHHPLVTIARQILDAKAHCYVGTNKYQLGATFRLSRESLDKIELSHLGYSDQKLRTLDKIYYRPEEFDRAKAILRRREGSIHDNVAIVMRNQEKPDGRSLGWCMNSLVVTRWRKKRDVVTLQYRSTETTKKLGGDLAYLRVLIDRLKIDPERVIVQAASCFMSGVYLTYLGNVWPGCHVTMLRYIEEADLDYFRVCSRFLLRSCLGRDKIFRYGPEILAHRWNWDHVIDTSAIRDYLLERHNQFGDPLQDPYFKKD